MFSSNLETQQQRLQVSWYQTCWVDSLSNFFGNTYPKGDLSLWKIPYFSQIFLKLQHGHQYYLQWCDHQSGSGRSIIKDVASSATQPSAATTCRGMIPIKCKWCGKIFAAGITHWQWCTLLVTPESMQLVIWCSAFLLQVILQVILWQGLLRVLTISELRYSNFL